MKKVKAPTSRSNPAPKAYLFYGIFAAILCTGMTAACIFFGEFPFLISYLIGINNAALFFMGFDKVLARSNSTRLPEAVALMMALFGGSPGTLLGVHIFKHKMKKASFQFILLMIIAVQLFILKQIGFSLR